MRIPSALVAAVCGALAAPLARADITVNPGESIQAAIAAAAPGERVTVKKGVYLLPPGDGGGPIVVDKAIELVGKGAVIDAGYQSDGILVTADGVTVRGFTVVNAVVGIRAHEAFDDGGGPDLIALPPAGLVITKNTVLSCEKQGMRLTVTDARIEGNTVEDCAKDGIKVWAGMSLAPTVVRGNRVRFNGDDGIEVEGHHLLVERNRTESNFDDGIDLTLFPTGGADGEVAGPPVVVSRNRSQHNKDAGIEIDDESGSGALTERNTCTGNGGEGLNVQVATAVDDDEGDGGAAEPTHSIVRNACHRNLGAGIGAMGANLLVDRNRADGNSKAGLWLTVDGSNALDNRASGNGASGLAVLDADGPGDGEEGGDGNLLAGNRCDRNGWDGMLVSGNSNAIAGNRCDRNLSDGISLFSTGERPDGAPGDNLVVGNRCKGNQGEGIDNGAAATDILDNVCTNNALGVGADIAGRGSSATGTVDVYEGNVGSGGPDTIGGHDPLGGT